MANDNKANYAKVGFALFLGILAIIGSLVYFGGLGDRQNEFLCETYYDRPVSGLSVGSEVNLSGIKVGEVRDISFVGAEYPHHAREDAHIIVIRMALNRHLCRLGADEPASTVLARVVERGLRATVSPSGITGLSKLELNFPHKGQEPSPVRPISWQPDFAWIPPEPSMLESFSDSVTAVMNRFKRMDFTVAWSNLASIAQSVADLSSGASALLEGQRAHVDEILSNLTSASRSIKELAEDLKSNPSLLLRAADPQPLPETMK
ncbi:MAG: MlaD family protein [Kiritimatiellia bacterium]